MTDWLSRITLLTEADAPAMYGLEQRMLSALPSPRWYYPSTEAELAAQARQGHAAGIREAGELIALNILVPAKEAHHGGYAAALGRHEPRSLDFEDVMVDPAWRRQGIHSAFLARAEAEARRLGCTAVSPPWTRTISPVWAPFSRRATGKPPGGLPTTRVPGYICAFPPAGTGSQPRPSRPMGKASMAAAWPRARGGA